MAAGGCGSGLYGSIPARSKRSLETPMSLDFIVLKSHGRSLSMDDIDMDTSFKRADHIALADRFFDGIVWSDRKVLLRLTT